MKTLRVLICDDEKVYSDRLNKLLRQYECHHELTLDIDIHESGNALLEEEGYAYDMAFLDIEMGGLNGIELAEEIKLRDPQALLVFITNHSGYAIDAFRIRAFHYLKKPMDYDAVVKVMGLLLEAIGNRDREKVFTAKCFQSIRSVPHRDILYFEKKRNKTCIVTASETIEIYDTLKNILDQLRHEPFCQCHQGFIVSLSQIDRIEKNEISLRSGDRIPLSKSNQTEVKMQYMSYLNGEYR